MKSKIEQLEKRIAEQQKEIVRLNKKAKSSSFWLFWLLSKQDGGLK